MVSYLQINHEFNESLAVMYFVHGHGSYGKGGRKSWRLGVTSDQGMHAVIDKCNMTDNQT